MKKTALVALLVLATFVSAKPDYGSFVDGRDGKVYRTVKIGGQTWMAENLNHKYKVNGSVYGNWCYNDSAKHCVEYGRFYTWAAAMDSATTGCGYGAVCKVRDKERGVCPSGWHIPSSSEWETLFEAVGGGDVAGGVLKSSGDWNDLLDPDLKVRGGRDSCGFSALPSGHGTGDGQFSAKGSFAVFWSSYSYDMSAARVAVMFYNGDNVKLLRSDKRHATPVRCVKD